MPSVSPKKKPPSLSRPAMRLAVRISPGGGTLSVNDEVDYLRPLRIERSAGGQRLDAITLAYDLGMREEQIVDVLAPGGVDRQVEISLLDQKGKIFQTVAWGKLARQPLTIGEGEERRELVARIDKQHFGNPLGRIPFLSVDDSDAAGSDVFVFLDRPITFNPTVDGIVRANRSDKLYDTYGGKVPVWFAEASPFTAAAQAYAGQVPQYWRLFEAVRACIWLCNPYETYITNPSYAELEAQLGDVDSATDPRLVDVTLHQGMTLPEVLDELLGRAGCNWFIEHVRVGSIVKHVIRTFRRGIGTKREVFLQRPGSTLDLAKTNLKQAAVVYDVSDLANEIIGVSARRLVESTWELYKGWPEDEDTLELEALENDVDAQRQHPHAGRKWVLNESGAWTGLRPEITDFTSLKDLFESQPTVETTRKFLPCLSTMEIDDGNRREPREVYVEWYNPDNSAWEKVPWSFSVLENECGIWFETIPDTLWKMMGDPDSVRIRVTATVQGDTGIEATAYKRASSPNVDRVKLRLDLSDKFFKKRVAFTSIFFADAAYADVRDDTAKMTKYIQAIRDTEDAALLTCSLVLEGIDRPEYQIGDLVTNIRYRNIKLERRAQQLASGNHPQIVGINIDPQAQTTELILETHEAERP